MPEEVYVQLKERAKRNGLSMNRQAIVELSRAVGFTSAGDWTRKRRKAEEMIESVEKIRRRMPRFMTAEEIDAAKREGRP